jgi:drug/metabolite transporter (DMT)-like permease
VQASSEQRWALLGIWVIPAFWAVNYLIARIAPGIVQPHTLAMGRFLFVGLVLGWICRQELWQHRAHIFSQWRQYLALGVMGMLFCGAWVYVAAITSPAMNIALIYTSSPVMITLGAALWLRERLRAPQLIGFMLAITGVLHVVLKGQWLSVSNVQWVMGDMLVLLAAVSWAFFALLQKHWATPLSAFARLAVISLAGCLVLSPFVGWEWSDPSRPVWHWQASVLVLAAGIFPGIGAYAIYAWAQRHLGASKVGLALYLSPLWGALVSWGILGEPLGWHHLIGALLILPGVALAQSTHR